MGEYIKVDGKEVKLGTCEDLYYVRYNQLVGIVSSGRAAYVKGNHQPRQYLNPSNGFRFRFPFPDEDGVKVGEYEPYERGIPVICHEDPFPSFEHYVTWVRVTPSTTINMSNYGFNMSIPCPTKHNPMYRHSPIYGGALWEVVQQKPVKHVGLAVVIRCGWCGVMYALSLSDAEKLVEQIEKQTLYYPKEFWEELARRIMQGYEISIDF